MSTTLDKIPKTTVVAKAHLDSVSFRDFGQVIHVVTKEGETGGKKEEEVNQGSAKKHPWLAKLENLRGAGAEPDLSIFRCNPRPLELDGNGTEWFHLKVLERHPYSSQVFIPMDTPGAIMLVIVAKGKGDRPDLATVQAFLATAGQGINYGPGVWHSPVVCLERKTDFACLTWEDGTPDDCHVVDLLGESIKIALPSKKALNEKEKQEPEEPEIRLLTAPPAPPSLLKGVKWLTAVNSLKKTAPFWSELIDVLSSRIGGKILFATNDWFAEASKMINPEPPVFIPGKFTSFGKWMDGWESSRKRQAGHDWSLIRLALPAKLLGFEIDTGFFTGNQAPRISIQAACLDSSYKEAENHLLGLRKTDKGSSNNPIDGGFVASELTLNAGNMFYNSANWTEILPMTHLFQGYEEMRRHIFSVSPEICSPTKPSNEKGWTHIRVNIFPDGGVSRLVVRGEAVPKTIDPVEGLASSMNGGVAVTSSNAHYGRVSNLIAPGRAAKMDEGWETARNPRRPVVLTCNEQGMIELPSDQVDFAVLRLCALSTITGMEIDTNHFKGNCPESCQVEGALLDVKDPKQEAKECANAEWFPLLERTRLTPHHQHHFPHLENPRDATHVRLTIFPDGGVSRLRVFGKVKENNI